MKSVKEDTIEKKILKLLDEMQEAKSLEEGLPRTIVSNILTSDEVKAIHDYANTVSISRLGLNDHGPVHMKMVCYNALKMLRILHDAQVQTSLEKEGVGTFADSVSAVMIAALCMMLV